MSFYAFQETLPDFITSKPVKNIKNPNKLKYALKKNCKYYRRVQLQNGKYLTSIIITAPSGVKARFTRNILGKKSR